MSESNDTFELAPSNDDDDPRPLDVDLPKPVLPYRPAPLGAPVADDAVHLYFPDRTRDLYVPIALFLLAVIVIAAQLWHSVADANNALTMLAAFTIVKLTIMLFCIPLATRIIGASFGTLASAVAKFGAIALLPDALFFNVFQFLPFWPAFVAGPFLSFALCWTLFRTLFDLDGIESLACAVMYWIIGLVFAAAWYSLFNWLLNIAW